MDYVKIRNWEKYQHYSQRNPPWIKLHNSLLDDYEYGCLQDASKLLLITLFMLASRTENNIPADPDWIRSKGMLKGKIDIEPLIKANFIEYVPSCNQDASEVLAERKQNGGTEKRREEKRREETEGDHVRSASVSDEEWLNGLKSNPAYEGLDVDKSYHKMLTWCETNGKKPTRRRFVNWLNREERPLQASSNGGHKPWYDQS